MTDNETLSGSPAFCPVTLTQYCVPAVKVLTILNEVPVAVVVCETRFVVKPASVAVSTSKVTPEVPPAKVHVTVGVKETPIADAAGAVTTGVAITVVKLTDVETLSPSPAFFAVILT